MIKDRLCKGTNGYNARGWTIQGGGAADAIVDKFQNYRHEISVWRKANQPYGKIKYKEFYKRLWRKCKMI